MKHITKNIKWTLITLFIIIASKYETMRDIHVRNENFALAFLGASIQQIFLFI